MLYRVLLVACVMFGSVVESQAVTGTWIGSFGNVVSDWMNAANWAGGIIPSVAGDIANFPNPNAPGVPPGGDIVVINAPASLGSIINTCGRQLVIQAVTGGMLTVTATGSHVDGVSNTVIEAGITLRVNNGANLTSAGGGDKWRIVGTLELVDNAAIPATIRIFAGGGLIYSGSMARNAGNELIDGTTGLPYAPTPFPITFANTGGVTLGAGLTYAIGGNLTISPGCVLALNNNTILDLVGGTHCWNGSIRGNATASLRFLGGASACNCVSFVAPQTLNQLVLNGSGMGLVGNLTLVGTLSVLNGQLQIGSCPAPSRLILQSPGNVITNPSDIYLYANGTLEIQGNSTLGGGGTVQYDPGSTLSYTGAVNVPATGKELPAAMPGNVIIGNTAGVQFPTGTTDLNATLSFLAGGRLDFPGAAATLRLNGPVNWTGGLVNGTLNSTVNITAAPGGAITGNMTFFGGGQALNTLILNRNAQTLTLGSNLTIGNAGVGGLTLTDGTLNTGGQTLTLNANGATVSGSLLIMNNAPLQIGGGYAFSANGTVNMTGAAQFSFLGANSTLSLNRDIAWSAGTNMIGAGLNTATLTIGNIPGGAITGTMSAGGPIMQNLTLDRTGQTLNIGSSLSLSNSINLTNGIINMGAGTLGLTNGAGGAFTGSPFSATKMILGTFSRLITSAGSYDFPVGVGAAYFPVNLTGATGTPGTLTVTPFAVGSGGTPDNTTVSAVSGTEHWGFTSTVPLTSSVLVFGRSTANFPAGSRAAMTSPVATGVYAAIGNFLGVPNSNLLASNPITIPTGNSFFSSADVVPQTYTWNNAGGAWGTAGNWTPARTTPIANDILQFLGPTTPVGTLNITGIPAQTIGKLIIGVGRTVLLNGAGNLTVQGVGAAPHVDIQTSGRLAIGGLSPNDLVLAATTIMDVSGIFQSDNAANLTGTGTLNVLAGGTLQTSQPAGINGPGNSLVQTGVATYNNAANYIFTNTASTLTSGFAANGGLNAITQMNNFTIGGGVFNTTLANNIAVNGILDVQAGIFQVGAGSSLTLTRNAVGNTVNMVASMIVDGTLIIQDNSVIGGLGGVSYGGAGSLQYNGTVAAFPTTGRELPGTMNRPVTINNTQGINGGITLSQPTDFTNPSSLLTLTSGLLKSNGAAMPLFAGALPPVGASPVSYIDGPMRIQTSTAGPFSFPVGNLGQYLPMTISSVAGSATVEVEGYAANSGGSAGTALGVLGAEYWRAVAIAGSYSSAVVNLNRPAAIGMGSAVGFNPTPAPGGTYNGQGGTIGTGITSNAIANPVTGAAQYFAIGAAAPTTFYYKSGNPDPTLLTSWDGNLNGGGGSPSNFTAGTFIVPNGRTALFSAMTLPVFGNSTILQIESGGAIFIANGRTLTANGQLRVNGGGRLTLQGTGSVIAPSGVQYLSPTATLEYNAPINRLTSSTEFPNTMPAQVGIRSGTLRLNASKHLQSALLLDTSTVTFGAADRLRLSGALTFTSSNFVSDSTDTLMVDGTGSVAGSIGIPVLARLTMNRGGQTLAVSGTTQITQQLGLFGGNVSVPNGASVVVQSSADTALVGGNATSFVSGALVRQLLPNLTPTTTLPIFYPIGRASTYLPLTLTEATTGTVAPQVSAEAFAVGAGGTPALGVPGALSTSEYWRVTGVSGEFTGARVGVLRGGITSMNTLAFSATQTGLYTSVGGTLSNLSQGLSLLSDGASNSATRFYAIVGTLQGSPRITGFTPSVGGEGTTMLITGTNLTGVNAVAIGGIAVSRFTVLSSTTISVVVGAVSSGPVQVGSPLGGAASDSSFTFVPAPVIGGVFPNPVALGATITISGGNLSGTNGVIIGGVVIPPNNILQNPDGSISVQIPLTATTSTIILSTPGGTVITTNALVLIAAPVITSFSPAMASTGAVITILGQNFVSGMSVRFGTVPATVLTVNSSSRLSVVVPAQAAPMQSLANVGDKGSATLNSTWVQSVYLTIRTGGGTVTSATQFVYNAAANGSSGNNGVDPLRLVVLSEAYNKIVPIGGRVRVTGANLELIQELTLRTSISSTKASYILSSSAEMTVLVPSTGLLRSTNASLSSALVTVDALGAFNRTVVADMFTVVGVPVVTSVEPSDAAAGEEVLVRGENLDLIGGASIGGTPAMFRLVNGQVFVRVPAVDVSGVRLPASGVLSFTSLGGIATTAAVVNAALASGQPYIISFSPTTGVGGAVVVVSGVNFTRVTDALVGGVPVGSFVINSSTQMTITLNNQTTSSSQGGITLLSPLGASVSLQPFIFASSLAGDTEALERALRLSGLTLGDVAIEQTDNRVTSILAHGRPLNLTLEPFISALAPLSELRNLDLSNTGLTGAIPLNLAKFTKLERLNLSGNSLTGVLPSELFCSYKNLQVLDVSSNKLEGVIPICIATLDKVRTLNLSQNRFTGGLPKELGGMVSLEELLVNNNRLTGSLPPEFGTPNGGTVKRTVRVQSAQTLRVLDVSANELTGSLPAEWGGMSALQQLNVSHNRLSGVLASSIANWESLQVLNLGHNRFTGTVPTLTTTMLSMLNVEHNNFSGRLPEALNRASRLRVLKAGSNGLTGLPKLLRMDTLRVDSNRVEFGSLDSNLGARFFVYAPQDSIGSGGDTVVRVSSRLVIPSWIRGTKTVYQWLRNGRVLAGANAETLVLESAKAFQSGVYVCRATNSLLPQLTLFSRSYKLVVTGADQTLDAPELLFPSVQAENIAVRPRLKWSSVEGAEQYELTVGRDATLRDVVLRRTVSALAGSSEQSYRLEANDGALERGGQYFWRVRALAVGSEGIPSETRSFRVVPLGVDVGFSTIDAGRTLIGTQLTGDGVLVNVGTSAITLDSATAITNREVFSLTNQTRNVVMQSNEEVPINVAFTPSVAGEALASVQVWYKDAQQTQRQVRFDNALKGRGGALRVDEVNFDTIHVRRTALQSLRMINLSQDTVTLTGLHLLPTNSSEISRKEAGAFRVDDLNVMTLLPKDTVYVTVRCVYPEEADLGAEMRVLWRTRASADSASVGVRAVVRAVIPNKPFVTVGVKPRQDNLPPGSRVLLDVYIQEGNLDLLFKAAQPEIRAQIGFDPQVLALVSGGRQLRTSSSTRAVVEVQTRWESRSIILATLECRVVAGERVKTDAMLVGLQWGKPVTELLPTDQAVIVEEPEEPTTATFTARVSRAGGARLIAQSSSNATLSAMQPNPLLDISQITYSLQEQMSVQVVLLDVFGKVMKVLADRNHTKGEYTIPVSVHDLPTGTYFVVMRTPSEILTERVQVRR